MRKLQLALAFIIVNLTVLSQDIIVKKSGEELKTRIVEITTDVIKYKEYENMEGPLRNIALNEVFMVIYENGKRETFNIATKNNTNSQTKPAYSYKSPAASFWLSFLVPGLGQFYNRQPGKGIPMIATFGVSAICMGVALEDPVDEDLFYGAFTVLLIDKVWSMIDAPISSGVINRRNRQKYGFLDYKLNNHIDLALKPNYSFDTSIGKINPVYGARLTLRFR